MQKAILIIIVWFTYLISSDFRFKENFDNAIIQRDVKAVEKYVKTNITPEQKEQYLKLAYKMKNRTIIANLICGFSSFAIGSLSLYYGLEQFERLQSINFSAVESVLHNKANSLFRNMILRGLLLLGFGIKTLISIENFQNSKEYKKSERIIKLLEHNKKAP